MEWKREPDENERIVRSHTARAPWLRDTVTQQDTEMRRLRQLRLVATYGIGGCSRILLSPRQSDAWADLARGSKVSDTERAWIESFLKVAIPNAYRRVMHEQTDCRGYFLGEHNDRVIEQKPTESRKRLCLAREGEVKEIMNRGQASTLLMSNTLLLRSRIGKSLDRIGLIGFKDGTEEHAFLDFLPDARVGSRVIVHRNIACENF